MAIVSKAQGEAGGRWFRMQEDHGKPVRFYIRPVPDTVDREIRRRVYGKASTRSQQKQPAVYLMEKFERYVVLKAVYALVRTENFNVGILDALAAEEYSKLLGLEAEVGKEVCVDGRITEEAVREHVLSDFPKLADAIVTRADKMTVVELEEEDEATDSFSSGRASD